MSVHRRPVMVGKPWILFTSYPPSSSIIHDCRRDTSGTLQLRTSVARRFRAAKLEARGARLKLPVAKKPVFAKIGPGLGLGYRRNATAGTWVVRASDGQGGNWTTAIGTADDFDEA